MLNQQPKRKMMTVNQEIEAARIKFHKELDRLLGLLAAQQRIVENQPKRSAKTETARAEAVLAAQQRLKHAASG
jgi:hypothetical protein